MRCVTWMYTFKVCILLGPENSPPQPPKPAVRKCPPGAQVTTLQTDAKGTGMNKQYN